MQKCVWTKICKSVFELKYAKVCLNWNMQERVWTKICKSVFELKYAKVCLN